VSTHPALNRTLGKTIAGLLGLLLTMGLVATSESGAAASTSGRLSNLAHLDFLTAMVAPPHQDGHTTYRMEEEPDVGVLWVYADHQSDGSYRRVGGGDYDAATNT
jgi:hypothetical protein